jgi:hypothetical protein
MPDIVETMESPEGRWKAAIVRRSDALLQVLLLKRQEDQAGTASWALQGKSTAFFDDLAAARRAAQEMLAACP